MKTIEELRAEVMDAQRNVEELRNKAQAIGPNGEGIADALTAYDNAKAWADMLRDQLDAETEASKSRIEANTVKAAIDRVQKGASAFHDAGDFFRAVANNRQRTDARLSEYASIRDQATGQNITTDADGGYLVPPDYASELIKMAQGESVLYPLVAKAPISGNRLIEHYLTGATRADGVRGGGLQAYWKGEADQYTASKATFGEVATDLSKLTGLAYATEEMLQDAPAISSIIAQTFADEFTFKIDDAILNGTGSGMPLGILKTGNGGNAALVTIAKESGQAAGTIVMNNILKMWNALPAYLRSEAYWLINQDVEIVLMQMLMAAGTVAAGEASVISGVPVYLPMGGLSGQPYSMLLGRPVLPMEQCAAIGSVGDIVLVVPSKYRWIEKGGLNAQTSIHVRFDYDETAFKFTYRAGGRPIWPNPVTAYKGATQRSPYVALAARA